MHWFIYWYGYFEYPQYLASTSRENRLAQKTYDIKLGFMRFSCLTRY